VTLKKVVNMPKMDREKSVVSGDLRPLVSIITPAYKGAEYFLEELIQSVLEQDYPNIEHIIIDDGSPDDGATLEILKRYPHLRWWTRPNKGQYSTMNEGLRAARGEFVTFINQDDKYASPQAISSLVKVFLEEPRWDGVYGEVWRTDSEGRPDPLEGVHSTPMWLFRYTHGVMHSSILVGRKFLMQGNLFFDESLSYSSDYDWFNRMMQAGCRFSRIRKPIILFRLHSGQRTNEQYTAARRAEEKYLYKKYPCNPIISFFVKQWIILVRVKNLYRRAGLMRLLREWKAWIKRRIVPGN
jgi:glycosyltransferase involved in cell wall biosynthesis